LTVSQIIIIKQVSATLDVSQYNNLELSKAEMVFGRELTN